MVSAIKQSERKILSICSISYHFLVLNRAIQMADEFPRVEVTGVDLAPLQPT
jgi:hypothetical protein